MSEIITATGFMDPQLDAIRTQVGLKDDSIPFLLLPVKIETKFMKVDRPVSEKDPFPDVLEDLSKLEEYMRFDPKPLPSHEVTGRGRKITDMLRLIKENAEQVKRLTTRDKELLLAGLKNIEKENQKLTNGLSRYKTSDDKTAADLRNTRIQISAALTTTSRTIESLQPDLLTVEDPEALLFKSVELLTASLQQISTKDLSATERKQKRTLFGFLDEKLAAIASGMQHIQKILSINFPLKEQEIKKLDASIKTISRLFKDSDKNITRLKSGYKSVEYNTLLSALGKKFAVIQNQIETRAKPKMRMLAEFSKTDARNILARVNEVRRFANKASDQPIVNIRDVESVKKGLEKKLKGFSAEIHKIIEGNEEEFRFIGRAWEEADSGLRKLGNKINAFRDKQLRERSTDQPAEPLDISFLNELEGLKSPSKSAFRLLTNTAIEKSITNYTNAVKRLNELNELIKKDMDDPALSSAHLEAFRKTFVLASRDLYLLPTSSFDQLKKAAGTLEDNIRKMSKKAGKTRGGKESSMPLFDAGTIGSIQTLLDKFTDAPAEKKTDPGRNTLVFATKTSSVDELWVRFYPDDIAIQTHEESLTEDELLNGKAYWTEILSAGDDYELKLAAWRAISTSYGPQRASWIVQLLEPKQQGNEDIRKKLAATSNELAGLNKQLIEVHKMITGNTDHKKMFEVTGQGYPLLKKIETALGKIKAGHSSMLLKTQNNLLKIQSDINSMVREMRTMNDKERLDTGSKADVLKEFINTYNVIVKQFQSIDKLSSKEIVRGDSFPDIFPEVKTKDSSWTAAPHSRVMPDRFVVLTRRGGIYRHIKVGNPLPVDQLIVGLDPATFNNDTFQYDEDGNLIVDENIKWMTDFNDAVTKGMAVTIPLDEEDIELGFDQVYVLGLRDTDPLKGKQLIEDLVNNHHYIPEGASFIPVGTQTNNTESGTSGYRKTEEDAALSFEVERNNELPLNTIVDPAFPSDKTLLSQALGIGSSVFDHLDYSNRTEISESMVMNKALFHATIGNYMEEGLDSLFTLDNINHTKSFFNQFVTARGFLPSLRIGTQPYGILPTTAFSQFSITNDDSILPELTKEDFENPSAISDELQLRFDIRLKNLLNLLNNHWSAIRAGKVLFSGNTDPNDPQAHFMEMLGLHSRSVELYYRYGVNVASRQGTEEINMNFNSDDPWSPAKVAGSFRDQVFSGYYYKSDFFQDEQTDIPSVIDYLNLKYSRISDQFTKARVFTMRHLQDQAQILGHTIDNRELSEIITPPANPNSGTPEEMFEAREELPYYIDWLIDQNPWDVHAENRFSSVTETGISPGMTSKSLLFLLLRHSVLTAYADTILKILEFEKLTDQKTRKKMGAPAHYHQRFAGSFSYVTKWTYLFSQIHKLNFVLGYEMDTANPFYTYMNSLSGTSNGYLNRYISPKHTTVFNNYSNHSNHQRFIDELTETREAIRKLKDIPTLRLNNLLAEHIDLCTYRLDAWMLGMVNKRLKNHRKTKPTGLFIGSYGWVEALQKGGERKEATNLPPELWKTGDAPVYTDEDNLGFIHTPSLNHAITAAILRAGFNANKGIAEVDNQMAVNLSSERVRTALNLLNGIRNGQDAGTLLGYQYERGLHERYLHIPLELDQYIYDFREEFPMAIPVDATLALGEATLNQVVNGMELLESAQDFIDSKGGPPNPGDSLYQSLKTFETEWWQSIGNANLIAASAAKRDAMLKEIDRMADAFDGLGDLCISESVYQVAKGNHIRAGAILDKLAKGDVPNDIEIADTPRTGTVVTHKAGLFMDVVTGIDKALTKTGPGSLPLSGTALNTAVLNAKAASTGWTSAFTPRALAEPTLNKFIGGLIGNPSTIKCLVEYTIADVITKRTVTLAELEVQPLDVLHLFGSGPLDGGAELNTRIAAYARKHMVIPAGSEASADDITVNIHYTQRDDSAWTATDYSFYEKAGCIQSLQELVTNSAAMAADDLLIPGEEEVPVDEIRNLVIDELLIRVTNLDARLKIVRDSFTAFFRDEINVDNVEGHTFTNEQVDALRLLLNQAAPFGIPGTVSDSVVNYGNTVGNSLLNAADGAAKAINSRLSQVIPDILNGSNASLSADARANALKEAAKKLLGKAFVIIPQFKLRNAADLSAQINLATDKGLLRSASPFAMEEWSQSVSRVRQRLSILDTVQMWVENFNGLLPDKKVLQFPFLLGSDGKSIDHWLGVEFPAGYQPTEDKLSLILMNTSMIKTAPDSPKSALLIDEWVEIIPNTDETTGITFNYDQPDAKPPNTLLLAVTPRETGKWSWDNLVHTLNDTLELAKNRAVEPEHLEDTLFGQILPGILTEIVPPQLLPAGGENSGDAQDNPLGLQVVTDFGVVNDTYEPETEEV